MPIDGVLARIPGYGGYLAKRQYDEQQDTQDLQQMSSAATVFGQLQAQKDAQEIRGVLSTAKTPEEAVKALIPLGTKPALDLATHFKGLLAKPQTIVPAGSTVLDANGKPTFRAPEKSSFEAESPLAKLIRERDALEQNNPSRKHYDAAIARVTRGDEAVKTKPPNGYRFTADGSLQPIPGGPADKPTEKPLPVNAATRLVENHTNLRRAETALALMEGKDVGQMKGDSAATGWKGFVPDSLLQRFDEGGIDARAAIADLGSLVIHERSGAAVTAAEYPRLQPFIPSAKDDPETAKKKLRRFVQVYKDVAENTTDFYRESGYRVPDIKPLAPTAPAAAPTATTKGGWKVTPR